MGDMWIQATDISTENSNEQPWTLHVLNLQHTVTEKSHQQFITFIPLYSWEMEVFCITFDGA